MAITRAQQARQMLIKGGVVNPDGRRGFFTGAEKDARTKGTSISPGTAATGASRNVVSRANPYDVGFNLRDAQISKQYGDGVTPTDDTGAIIPVKDKPPPKKPEETKFQKFKRTVNPFPLTTSVLNKLTNSKLARINNAMQRQNYIDSLDLTNPEEKEEYDRIMNQLGGLGMGIIAGPEDLGDTSLKQPMSLGPPKTTFKTVDGVSALGDPGVKDVLGQGYQDYLNRFETEERDERPEEIIDPCKGPNPPAYCFIGEKADETIEAQRNLAGLTPRIGGSMFDFTQFAADGGRIGFFKGAVASGENISPGTDVRGNVRDDNPFTGGGGDVPKGPPSTGGGGDGGGVTTLKTKKDIRTPSDFTKFSMEDLISMGLVDEEDEDMKVAKTYSTEDIEKLLGIKDQKTAEQFIEDPYIGGPEFIGDKSQANIMEKFRENLLEQETKFPGKDFDAQRAGALSFGISPKNQSLVPSDFLDKPGEAATQMPFSTIAEEIEAKYPMAEGGIANLNREAFLLGGIAKGLKKAVRGVKKLAKSPIGKVALFASPFLFKKGLLSSIIGQKAMTQAPFAKGTGILGFLQSNPMESIFAASALAGLMTPKEGDNNEELAKYLAQNQLNPNAPLNTRIAGSQFDFYGGQLAADGGRIGYQEGSKEPVAKKTLPLIDMDGMEKDYRETGGFVEMGRMEKADDVPARLSKNEFVFTADAVRNAGEGDIDKGAEVMYNMMKNLEAGGEVSEESQGLEGAREMFQTSQRLGEVI